jgi:hypothetical protein
MTYLDAIARLESQVAQLQDARMEEARERDRLRSEVMRLRAALQDIQREAMMLKPPRHSWYYDRAQNALTNSEEPLVRDGLAPAGSNGDGK